MDNLLNLNHIFLYETTNLRSKYKIKYSSHKITTLLYEHNNTIQDT